MKNILYIGNKLKDSNRTQSSIDVLEPLLKNTGYGVISASSSSNIFFRLVDMLFVCINNRKKVDVVLIDTYSTLNFYYAFFVSQLCRLLRLKYIPILHGGNLSSRLKSTPALSKLIFNNAYKIIAPSNYMKSSFKDYGYQDVICIPNTIEIQDYAFKSRICDKPKLLWVRSFSEIYNPNLAVDVLYGLLQQGVDASLCMVGPEKDGSLQKAKAYAKELKIEVTFTGKLSKKEWIDISKNYNIFINTTNFDNMPVSVIEAMALGLPVISTNVGGIPFLIENKKEGILVSPNSKNEFITSILNLVKRSEVTSQLSLNARKKVAQFDWSIVKHQWVSVLQ